jgi:hypothetical protein
MYLLNAINSDRQTRLLNVFGQIAMFREIKKKLPTFVFWEYTLDGANIKWC